MTQQDLLNPKIIEEIKDCYICKGKLTDNRHVTCNFRRDVGKFTLEYFVVCEHYAKSNKWTVMMLSKGSPIFPPIGVN